MPVRKSAKEQIIAAYLVWIERKAPEKIRVWEVCEEARISKSTFYYHYESIEDVAEEIMGQFVKAVEKSLDYHKYQENIYFGGDLTRSKSQMFLEFVYEHRRVFRRFMESGYKLYFIEELSKGIIRAMQRQNYRRGEDVPEDDRLSAYEKMYYAYSVAGRSIGELLCWMESGFDLKPEELSKVLMNNALRCPRLVNNED